ncbi:hypothetical protein Tco_1312079 [Tanacetum coccineum]
MSNRYQELASLEQMASSKDFSNPLMVDSLPKTIWFSTHHASHKALASPKQTVLGKDFSNPLMADSLPKTLWLSMHHVVAMKHWLFQSKRLLDSLKLIALMDLCTKLFDKVIILEMLLLSIRRFMLRLSHVDEESSSSDFRCRRLFDFREFCQTGEDVNRKSMNGKNKLQRENKLQRYKLNTASVSLIMLVLSFYCWGYISTAERKAKDSEVCKITRADGTSSFHGDFQALLRRLDRQDLFQG